MQPENLEKTIRALTKRVPFKPYLLRFVSGEDIVVDHPEALVVRGGMGVHMSADGTPTLFDHEGVSEIAGDFPLRLAGD